MSKVKSIINKYNNLPVQVKASLWFLTSFFGAQVELLILDFFYYKRIIYQLLKRAYLKVFKRKVTIIKKESETIFEKRFENCKNFTKKIST